LLDEEVNEGCDIHPLFTELEELTGTGDSQSWRELAR
jgi:hypothetical protein